MVQAFVAVTMAGQVPLGCPDPPSATMDRCVWSFPLLKDGRSRRILVYESDFSNLPLWQPLSGSEPPVSLGEAIRLATFEVRRSFADFERWRFETASLAQWPEGWVYMVQWEPVNIQEEFGIILVPVLMSGQVIPLDRPERR